MKRYTYFFWRYRQWFKNEHGIKCFADICMFWIMQSVLRFSKKIENQIKKHKSQVEVFLSETTQREKDPVIGEDEYETINSKMKLYKLYLIVSFIAELTLNFFVVKSYITFKGILAIILQSLSASIFTVASIILFDHLFKQIFNEAPYKSEQKEPRKPINLIALSIMAIAYMYMMYNFTLIRGEQIEGTHGTGPITIALIIGGLVLPMIAGYFANERNKYLAAYTNTNRIAKCKKGKKDAEVLIEQKLETKEKYIKACIEEKWSVYCEFKNYKMVYNSRRGLPIEDLSESFCSSHEKFTKEALRRLFSEVQKEEDAIKPDIIYIPTRKQQKKLRVGGPSSASLILLILTTVSVLSSCTNAEKRNNCIVQIDDSKSISKDRNDKYQSIINDAILDNLGPKDKLIITFIDACSQSRSERVFSMDFSLIDFTNNTDGKNSEEENIKLRFNQFINDSIKPELTRIIQQKREERIDCSGYTDIIRSLKESEALIIENQPMSKMDMAINGLTGNENNEYNNILILLSDMINDDIEGQFSFSRIAKLSISDIHNKIASIDSTRMPDLSNVDVFVYGSTSSNQSVEMNEQIEKSRFFWEQFFERSHAVLKAYGYDVQDEIVDYFRK